MTTTTATETPFGPLEIRSPPAWKNLPSWLEGSQVIMVSRPEAVADVIMTAVAAVDRPTVAAGGGAR